MDDDKLIAEIESRFKMHTEQAAKYKAMLTAYHGTTSTSNGQVAKAVLNTPPGHAEHNEVLSILPSDKGTFEDKIIEILSDGLPRTVHELKIDYQKLTGINLPIKDLSSRLSGRVKYNKIGSVEILSYPRKIRAWWGLTNWLEGNGKKFKPEYQGLIRPAYIVMQKLFLDQDIEESA